MRRMREGLARTVQKLDRGVDGRSCITLLTDSSSSISHRAAGGTGRDHGVAVPSTAAGSGDCRALVIPFVVVMRDELADGATQRALADQGHALEAGFLDGAHEALRVGVQVRRAGGESDGGDIGRGERVAPGRPEERVAVWMRNRMCRRNPSSASVAFRISWVTYGPSGSALMPAI